MAGMVIVILACKCIQKNIWTMILCVRCIENNKYLHAGLSEPNIKYSAFQKSETG
jgi:hypothetical protein